MLSPPSAKSQTLRALVVLLSCVLLCVQITYAQEQRDLKTDVVDKIDAVLLLDSSGSMLQTDPHRLREEGAKLFVQFLHPGDRIAIMQFDRDAKIIRPFSDFKPEDLASIGADISKIVPSGLYTDLLTGITAAGDLLKQQKRPDAAGIIVLMSDGKMEPDPAVGTAQARTDDLMNAVLPSLKAAGIKVDTLAFSSESDRQELGQIALATDGLGWFTPDAEKIHESFANLFLAVKKPQLLPLSSKGFTVDAQISEATFYVNRGDGGDVSLITPKGKVLRSGELNDNIKWFRGQKFDVITITNPEPGNWKIDGLLSSDDFATVLTNLKLVTDWPASITAGEPTLLQARLNDGDRPVALKEMSGATRYGIQIIPSDKVAEPVLEDVLYDDGTHGDKIAGDGIFSYKVKINEPGEYKVLIVAKAPTFDRRQQIPFHVRPPIISLSVLNEAGENLSLVGHGNSSMPAEKGDEVPSKDEPAQTGRVRIHGSAGDRIAIELSPEVSSYKDVQVVLTAIDAQRAKFTIPLEAAGDGIHFSVAQSILPHAGLFELQATVSGESKKHSPLHEDSHQVQYNNPKGESSGTAVEVVVQKKSTDVVAGPSGIPQALAVLFVNLGVGAFLTLRMKKQRSSGGVVLPQFVPSDAAMAALNEMEVRRTLNEIAFDDKIFENEVVLPPLPTALAALETAPASAPSGAAVSAEKEAPAETTEHEQPAEEPKE